MRSFDLAFLLALAWADWGTDRLRVASSASVDSAPVLVVQKQGPELRIQRINLLTGELSPRRPSRLGRPCQIHQSRLTGASASIGAGTMELMATAAVKTIDSSIFPDGIAFDSLTQVVYLISSGARYVYAMVWGAVGSV